MSEEIVPGVRPTRSELLKLRRRVETAQRGHDLLEEKRDALITELFGMVDEIKGARKRVEEKLEDSYIDLTIAQAVLGIDAVRQVSLMTAHSIDMDFDARSIMGIRIPVVELESAKRSVTQRGYGFVDTSSAIDKCASQFEDVIEMIVKLAEVEESAKRIGDELIKTKRRVSALEHFVIPRLRNTVRYIRMKLDEMERDNFARLKKIKMRLEEKAKERAE